MRMIHLGSDTDEDNQEDDDSSCHSISESSSENEEGLKFAHLQTEESLSEDKLKGFKVHGKLGKGVFAKVTLAKDLNNNLYAMKKMNKDFLEETKVLEYVLNEQKILQEIENPFLLKMKHTFETESKIYFFTDFMIGKDLKYQLEKNERGLTLNEIKMIGAQLVLGLECLHKNGYLHRDIKPENVMINKDGYIKLADFGLSNTLSSKEKIGAAGSIEYMAPEVINQDDYSNNPSVDWWALGILLYDLHYQETPFWSKQAVITFGDRIEEKIKEFINNQELQFPSDPQPGRDREYNQFK